MLSYLIRRTLYMIPILFGVAVLTFALFTFFGEDPVRLTLGMHATPESIAALEAKWGLNKPLWQQFVDFLIQIVTFDYGRSYSTNQNLMTLFKEGALVSFSLTAPVYFVGVLVYISIALYIAYHREHLLDKLSRALFIMSMSISYLVYIIVFQYFLAFELGWFPIQGFEPGFAAIEYLMLPWIIIFIVSMGGDIRIYRTIFLDEIKSDYVRTARAKGVTENRVLFVHVLKNAMIPIVTNTVIAIPFLILGAFLMERYFSLPGIGDLMITAINEGDFPIIKAMTILSAIFFSVFNLLTDILYAVFDPRVKLG